MDVEQPTVEAQLLDQAKRQTVAMEMLRNLAVFWSVLVPVVALIWLIVLFH